MDIKLLEKIGLTEGEAKVYMASLSLGQSTTGAIIKEAKVSTSKVYNILDRLSKKGLVSTIIKNNRKYFKASDPSRLKEFIEIKEKEILEEKAEIDKMIPSLQQMQKYAAPKQEAEILEGIRGIKTFSELILKELKGTDMFYVLGAPKEVEEQIGAYFLDWHKRRAKQRIKCKILYNFDAKERAEQIKEISFTEIRFLPENIYTPALIDIGKDYIATILFGENPICFVIKNKKIAESYRNYFELLWKTAKK